MKKETRLIKNIIKFYLPFIKCNYKFKKASNYRESSDKIIVTIVNGDKLLQSKIIKIVNDNTQFIKVYKSGDIVSIQGNHNPSVKNIDTNEFINVDILEFIEIKIG